MTSFQLGNILKSNSYSVHFEALVKKLQDASHHTRVLGYMITTALLRLLSGEHQLDAAHRVLDAMKIEELSGIEDVSLQTQNLSDVNHFIELTFSNADRPCRSLTQNHLERLPS